MKKKLFRILTILLITMLATSPAYAAGGLKFRSIELSPGGSLIVTGELTGLGSTDVTVVLEASGNAAIICTNNGSNDVPGQSYPNLTATGSDVLPGDDPLRKNGRSPFEVHAEEPDTLPWDVAGCPSANWTGRIAFILWTNATVSVYNTATWELLLQQSFVCDPALQTATTVSCTPVP